MNKREFLQKPENFNPLEHKIGGWCLSEKVGPRCFWDGGITRGMRPLDIPWASVVDPVNYAVKKDLVPFSTGLWSKDCTTIYAPSWFLDKLPPFACDGALVNETEFAIFSAPPWGHFIETGEIKNETTSIEIHKETTENWLRRTIGQITTTPDGATFEQELFALRSWENWDDNVYILKQTMLPDDEVSAVSMLNKCLKELVKTADGIILRDKLSSWFPRRVNTCLKLEIH